MDFSLLVSPIIFSAVFFLLATRLVHRAVAALVGALGVAAWLHPLPALTFVVPEVLVIAAGLMILAGFVKRSGLAAWLALKAAKAGRGHPPRILVLTTILTFLAGTLFGPAAAVVLVVPVALLLATELDLAPLPFVIVLNWAALLGGATTMTAFPGHLWMATVLGLTGLDWVLQILPLTASALAATLLAGLLGFRKQLRATHERRARILEFDESQSWGEKGLVVKTLVVLSLVLAGLLAGPWVSLAPSITIAAGAIALLVLDGPQAVDRTLNDLEGGTLLFYGGLFIVVGASAGWMTLAAPLVPQNIFGLLWGSALLGSIIDHGAVVGMLAPLLKTWVASGNAALWPFIVLGASLGAGASVWGSVSTSTALGLAAQGSRRPSWRDFSRYGLAFGVLNLTVVSFLGWLWVR